MSNQKSVESLIKVDKMECGEMFAKFLFENVGANADISSLLGSKTKMEFVMRATAMSDSVKDMDTLRLLVAVVSALPWDVPKEKKGDC